MHRIALSSLFVVLACDSGPKPAQDPAPASPASKSNAGVAPIANPLVDPAARAAVGQPAPDFTLPAVDGSTVKLSDLKGKRVVIEWFNPECPFVKSAHGEGPLKDMAATTTATGVAWLAINSGAPGMQGHGAEVNKKAAAEWSMTHPILLDETGAVGEAYGATNTPHMYIVDEKGLLVYRGGLDNAPMGVPEPGEPHTAHLLDALAALAAGKSVAAAETRAWGCSVKYAKK
jgi:peroxiredoxin